MLTKRKKRLGLPTGAMTVAAAVERRKVLGTDNPTGEKLCNDCRRLDVQSKLECGKTHAGPAIIDSKAVMTVVSCVS
jgi:hypothetical protein